MKPQEIDNKGLIDSLRSTVCPACGGPKHAKMSLCGRQYRQLPPAMRNALYRRIGNGYREAFIEAMSFFDIDQGENAGAAVRR